MKVCMWKPNAFTRSTLLKGRSEENRLLYKKQRNKYVSLLKKVKKKYYETLNEQNVIDNEQFWKTKIDRSREI